VLRIILFRDEKRKEKCVQTALAHARQIELAVLHALANISAMIELTIDHMDMCVERKDLWWTH